MNRDVLVKINYLVIFGILSISCLTVNRLDSPEKLIEGEWVETTWSIEKGNAKDSLPTGSSLYHELKKEILQDFQELHLGVWNFSDNRKLISSNQPRQQQLEWYIKGRGHILELHRDGRPLESFQIQSISKNKVVLHLNFDLQVKGILEIVLERKEKMERKGKYAEKV